MITWPFCIHVISVTIYSSKEIYCVEFSNNTHMQHTHAQCTHTHTHTHTAENLFFTNPVPSTLNTGSEVDNFTCSVPDIPNAVQTIFPPSPTDYLYCSVTTDRGTFRSSSVAIVDPGKPSTHGGGGRRYMYVAFLILTECRLCRRVYTHVHRGNPVPTLSFILP